MRKEVSREYAKTWSETERFKKAQLQQARMEEKRRLQQQLEEQSQQYRKEEELKKELSKYKKECYLKGLRQQQEQQTIARTHTSMQEVLEAQKV